MSDIVLAIDLDGCLYDWHSAVHTFFEYEHNYSGAFDEFWTEYIPSLSKARQEYIVSIPFLYETQVPSKSTIDFLNFAKENSKDIYYLTKRPKDLERVSKRYFKRYDFPYPENIFFTDDKAMSCRYFGVTHFLDDFVSHVKAVSGIADAYLMAKPWNKEFQEDFKTVHSLKEFKEIVFA